MPAQAVKPITTIENPYASPQAVEIHESAEVLLRATTRMYRGIGGAGVACCALAYPIAMAVETAAGTFNEADISGGMFGFPLMVFFFVIVFQTARLLEVNFDRAYRRARWLGILAATIFFPLLTWPGILAVRRLERYRKFVNNQRQAES